MDKQFLLKEFRLGFKSVKDKPNRKVYVAIGQLEKKVSRLNTISLLLVLFSTVIIFSGIIKSMPVQLLVILLYFAILTIVLKQIGKRMITEEDLKDVIVKELYL